MTSLRLEDHRSWLEGLVRAWVERRFPRMAEGAQSVEVTGMEPLHRAELELWAISAKVEDRAAHAVIGLWPPDAQWQTVGRADDPVLGVIELDEGPRLGVDALAESNLAVLTVETILGGTEHFLHAVLAGEDEDRIQVSFDDRVSLTVFPWPFQGQNPGVEMLLKLDETGFNHLLAPLAIWRHGGSDLGVVQEVIVGAAPGHAVALTSLRDLYAARVSPQLAGGDFAAEAQALGKMAARMHLALANAFGQRTSQIALDEEALDEGDAVTAPVIRTHGDFRLERTARSDQGWLLQDTMPGGCQVGTNEVVRRSPLADVGDMILSFAAIALEAAQVRDPTGRLGSSVLGRAWHERNAAAFLRGYLETANIEQLLPADSVMIDRLVAYYSRRQYLAELWL